MQGRKTSFAERREKDIMIEASIRAVAGLIPVFAAVAVLIAVPVALLARAKKWPTTAVTLWSVSLAGVLAVTLLPGGMGNSGGDITCYIGPSFRGVLSTTPGQLNVLLFVPVSAFGVSAFRRPVPVLGGGLLLSGGVELLQALLPLGRSCGYSDLAANTLGTVAGVLCGLAWLAIRRRGPVLSWRETRRSISCLGAGGAVVAAALCFGVTPLHAGAEAVGATAEQDRWARSVAVQVYGPDTKVVQVKQREAAPGFPGKVDVTTDQGNLMLLWPERKIQSVFSVDSKDDGGSLTAEQARAVGERFAEKWYADEIRGGRATFDPLAKNGAPYVLSYRRYKDDVMMPLRLDITVTSSGRIMEINAHLLPDPDLPKSELSEAAAKKRAEQLSGMKAGDPAFMIAQEVFGAWRPVWVINMIQDGESGPHGTAVHLDAFSGQMVQSQE